MLDPAMMGQTGDISSLLSQPTGQPEAADPLQGLQDAIHAVTGALPALADPQDNQDAIQALLTLSRIQTRLMKGAGAGGPGR